MTTELINFGISIEYDADENNAVPANIFLFQMLNRLNYEFPVKSLRLKGKERKFTPDAPLPECELKTDLAVTGKPFTE